ncbi:unnamed protein product [Rangifer tarandus platyrhynchus]|uniref:BTB domain-containing protein n=1 Tax=Rangifer tarandus platyrhynchus TaxID=3082113 RepID=A0ABN8ZJT0_RANTA|nr:unnamed protein product [Rangifer tarandus platyrhynchus]
MPHIPLTPREAGGVHCFKSIKTYANSPEAPQEEASRSLRECRPGPSNRTAMEAEETMECLQEFPEHHKMILDRLNEQREQDRFTDITLIVDGHHFKAHKAVLAACSKFFYKFFQEFTQEPLVEIEGVSKMAFRRLIEFTYTAKLMIQGEEEANDVWKSAEFLQMLEAIKALEVRNKENSAPLEENTTGKNEAKKERLQKLQMLSLSHCHLQNLNLLKLSWDQFKDHLVIHTGDKPNHCTLCDLWFMQGNELRRHLSDTHNISERLVTEEVLSVETRVQTEPVTSMTIIEQVGKVHVLPLLQVQVDSAQVTVEQVHPDLLQDSQVHESHISELPEQVQVSYLEVGRIQTEEGTEVHVEELHVERVNQMPVEVQTELLEADLDQVTPEIMNQEEREPTQADAAEAATEEHEDAEALETKSTVDSQAEKAGNENRTPMPVLE